MKKILVVLLVLAVAGGVFAQQGSWSLDGEVRIGAMIDFDSQNTVTYPDGEVKENVPAFVGSSYWAPYDYYARMDGLFNIKYSLDELTAGLHFEALNNSLYGDFVYDGGSFKFQAESSLKGFQLGNAGRLWGYYKLADERVHLEVAYNGRDNGGSGFWGSDLNGAFWASDGAPRNLNPIIDVVGQGNDAGPFGGGNTFTKTDHNNFMMVDVQLDGINFGVYLPNLFLTSQIASEVKAYQSDIYGKYPMVFALPGSDDEGKFNQFPRANERMGYPLMDLVLKQLVFGVKLNMSPIEVATQFLLDDYGVYIGGKFNISAVTIGASFMGIMDSKDSSGEKITKMKVGGNVEYNAGVFGANVKGFFGKYGYSDAYVNQIGVEPGFFYKAIPSHLYFQTDVGFYFTNVMLDGKKDDDASAVTWAIQPQVFWNFLGTGAGTWYSGLNTGMIFRYRLVSDEMNALDMTFRFKF